jgi:hypothetical protein
MSSFHFEGNRFMQCAPTHRHIKSNGLYEKLHEGLLEATLQPVTIYRDESGQVWVRPTSEFEDGRFEPYSMPVPLPAPPREDATHD